MLAHLLNFIFPPRCAGCGVRMPIEAADPLCAACLAQIDLLEAPLCEMCGAPLDARAGGASRCVSCVAWPPSYARAYAVAGYRAHDDGSKLASIIRRHKYGLDQSLSRALLQCLGEHLPPWAGECELVVPVPLHPRRLRWRGFNQATLLAAEIARRMALPLDVTALARCRFTAAQTGQDRQERRRNVRGSFIVRRRGRISGKRVLLVDDVMTTGATADECARTLLDAGACAVDVFTLARAL